MECGFSEADRSPDIEFNEIVRKSVKGRNAVMLAPVRSISVRPLDKGSVSER